jgi:hypothetical protein
MKKKRLLTFLIITPIVCLSQISNGLTLDTSIYLTKTDKIVVNLMAKEIKQLEKQSLGKDTIINELVERINWKDVMINSNKKTIADYNNKTSKLEKENVNLKNSIIKYKSRYNIALTVAIIEGVILTLLLL